MFFLGNIYIWLYLKTVSVSGLNLGGMQIREGISYSPKEKLEVQLTGLKPDTYYRVFLSGSTRAGIGEPIFLDTNTLPAGSKLNNLKHTHSMVVWVPESCALYRFRQQNKVWPNPISSEVSLVSEQSFRNEFR